MQRQQRAHPPSHPRRQFPQHHLLLSLGGWSWACEMGSYPCSWQQLPQCCWAWGKQRRVAAQGVRMQTLRAARCPLPQACPMPQP